jgi:hypothetical protein
MQGATLRDFTAENLRTQSNAEGLCAGSRLLMFSTVKKQYMSNLLTQEATNKAYRSWCWLAGLAAAYELRKMGYDGLVLEVRKLTSGRGSLSYQVFNSQLT